MKFAVKRDLVVAVLLLVTGCSSTIDIPQGGQVVHVSATATELLLDPSTVAPGDVYLVLEQAAETITFVHRSADGRDPRSPPRPVTDADIATTRREQTFQGASLVVLGGGHGDVLKIGPLVAGKYVLLGGRDQLAVLEVKE